MRASNGESSRGQKDTKRFSFYVTVSDHTTKLHVTCRCKDRSAGSIAAPQLAESAVTHGIGRIARITAVNISVAPRQGKKAQEFIFSRQMTMPRTTLYLSSRQLDLTNICFFVANYHLSCKDILIGLPLLQHFRKDRRTLVEAQRDALDGTDCADASNPTVVSAGNVRH